jgi:hypothetical protein
MCVSDTVSFGQKGVLCTGHIQKAMARFVDDILVMSLRTAKIIVMTLVTNLKISDDS